MAKTLEEIAKQLKKMKFKSALVGGVDKKDVWKKIERLNDDYMQYIEQQRIGYEAVLAEKDRMIAGGITVNAAQILPGPGAMPPMDPGMMGVAPFGGPSMAPFGDPAMAPYGDPSSTASGPPSPQGEGLNGYGSGAPFPQGEGMYGGTQDLPLEGKVAAQPTDEVFYPMPPMDPNMMGAMPPFDPAMMAMPMPMPGADYAPPAGGFEPDWGTPAPADLAYAHPVDMHPHGDPAMAQMGNPSSTASGPPVSAPLRSAQNQDPPDLVRPQGEGMYGMPPIPPMTPPGPQMPPFNPGPVPGGMPVSPEGVG